MCNRSRISLVWILSLFSVAGCAVHEPGLQQYDVKEVYSYLRQYGFKGDGIHYFWQDSDGRALYFGDGDLADHVSGHIVFILRQDRDEPIRAIVPPENYDPYWIGPQGHLRFMPPYVPSADERDRGNMYVEDDMQSPYFTMQTSDGKMIYVGSYTKLDGWLFSVPIPVNMPWWLLGITGRSDVVYLQDDSDAKAFGFLHRAINCWAYKPDPKDPGKYEKVDQFSVPGMIVALDPFSPRCICQGYGPCLFNYRHFVFDTQTHKNLGWLPDSTLAAFLDGDWLTPRLARVKHSATTK
jgi:hypothetical protein